MKKPTKPIKNSSKLVHWEKELENIIFMDFYDQKDHSAAEIPGLKKFIKKLLKAQREEIRKEEVEKIDIEIEAWMEVHWKKDRGFSTQDLMKHLRKEILV